MIFEAVWESAQRGELILVDGGMVRFHVRRDGQLTIHELIVLTPRQGIGTRLLDRLKQVPGVVRIAARCPADLAANSWYQARGFQFGGSALTRSNRRINTWYLPLA